MNCAMREIGQRLVERGKNVLSRTESTMTHVHPLIARGNSVVFHTKLGATAWTTYAKSLAAATSKARFSVSPAQISLIHVRMSGPAFCYLRQHMSSHSHFPVSYSLILPEWKGGDDRGELWRAGGGVSNAASVDYPGMVDGVGW